MLKTFLIILEQSFLYFPLILGAYFSISLMKVPDLSIEAAYVFGAILASKQLIAVKGIPIFLSIFLTTVAALFGGMIVGLISSLLTQKAKIPHLLSSIMTIGLFHGINQFVLGSPNVSLSDQVNILEYFNIFDFFVRNPEFLALSLIFVVVAVKAYLFLKTQLGYSLAIYGNNPKFFENYGISTQFIFIVGIVIANALAGFSGYLVVQSSGFVDIGMGFGMALFCITCLILGKTLVFSKKVFSIYVPVFGVLAYFFIQQTLLKVGLNLKYFTMVQSLLVLIVIANKMRKQFATRGELKVDNLGV